MVNYSPERICLATVYVCMVPKAKNCVNLFKRRWRKRGKERIRSSSSRRRRKNRRERRRKRKKRIKKRWRKERKWKEEQKETETVCGL